MDDPLSVNALSRDEPGLEQPLPPPHLGLPQATPGLGKGWTRVAEEVAKTIPPDEIKRIWVFPPLRRDGREWGTAVVARGIPEDRVVVLTARYMLLTRGKKKGQGKVSVEEVGESPTPVVDEVVRGVQERAGEADPPVEIDPLMWFTADDDEPAPEG
jgi:hypothetical protein